MAFLTDPEQMYPEYLSQPAGPYNPPQPNRLPGMPMPLNDISPIPTAPGAATTAAGIAALGEPQAQGILKQPGNRKSIKEYLAEIRALRANLAAQGVPEDQLPVPTFGNVQGGFADVTQGYLPAERGANTPSGYAPAGPGREVRGHVTPEFIQGPGGPGDMRMGPEHPMMKLQKQMAGQQASNPFSPDWANKKTMGMFQEIYGELEKANGRPPTPQEFEKAADAVRSGLMKVQAQEVGEYKKIFKDADVQDLFKAWETGDWTYAEKEQANLLGPKKIDQVIDDARKEWNKATGPENVIGTRPVNPETGEEFASLGSYLDYKISEYKQGVMQILEAMHQQAVKQPAAGKPEEGAAKGQKKVVKTGTYQGKKVVMYDDGTVDYAK